MHADYSEPGGGAEIDLGVDPMQAFAPPAPRRVVLADDKAVERAGLRALIERAPDLAVAGEAVTGVEALHLGTHARPDLLVIALSLPDPPADSIIGRLRANRPDLPILVLTDDDDAGAVRRALALGVAGVARKADPLATLLQAIRAVAAGGHWLSPALRPTLAAEENPASPASPAALSPREGEVVALVAAGHDAREIAQALGLGHRTVRNYLSRLYAKVGVRGRAELVIWARDHGLGPGG